MLYLWKKWALVGIMKLGLAANDKLSGREMDLSNSYSY